MRLFLLFIITFLSSTLVNAQSVENTNVMQQNGRIYVVVAVVVTILIGLFIYVWSLDRKIRKMEENK
jgi:uncharacterized membrane protein